MTSPLVIVDYGLGNLGSVANMLKKLSVRPIISSKPEDLRSAKALILPGVGHYDAGMKNLRERGLVELLTERVMKDRVPVLGICLGMQLLARGSEEGTEPGLGWVQADVKKFSFPPERRLPIPHMGWNEIEPSTHRLFANAEAPRYYFVHSFFMKPDDAADVMAWSTYGQRFCAAVNHENVFGVQFHPEKSHRFGLALLRNFVELTGVC